MALTRAIEQRLEKIEQDVSQGMSHDADQVLVSAADVNWLILLARTAVNREPVLSRRHQKLTRISVYALIFSMSVLSVAGLIWGIRAIIKLF